ncbi:MAG: class I SAM-dependent methyltransferase [Oscillochloris sp.]|nr:class I SAM-dependent methyltransferase [Oscillochloris sp.]
MIATSVEQPLPEIQDGERVVPGRAPLYLFEKHASRYQFIVAQSGGRDLLEMGSGDGYGAYFLADHARSLLGVDIDRATVARAAARYVQPNLRFALMDCARLSLPDAQFDLVYSFEVIEHVPDVDAFLAEARRMLRPGGSFYVSTPNRHGYVASGRNPYHETEYTYAEFAELLGRHFGEVQIFGQFCRRPLRGALYRTSSRLFFDSPGYRRLVYGVAPIYARLFWNGEEPQARNWVAGVNRSAFAYASEDADQADSFLAFCRV